MPPGHPQAQRKCSESTQSHDCGEQPGCWSRREKRLEGQEGRRPEDEACGLTYVGATCEDIRVAWARPPGSATAEVAPDLILTDLMPARAATAEQH